MKLVSCSLLMRSLRTANVFYLFIYFLRSWNVSRYIWSLSNILPTDVLFITLRMLTGKKQPQIIFQRFRKFWIGTFGWLIHQINYLYKVRKLKQSFWKKKAVAGKSPFFVIVPFCTLHYICLNIGFWPGSFILKCSVFILSTFN